MPIVTPSPTPEDPPLPGPSVPGLPTTTAPMRPVTSGSDGMDLCAGTTNQDNAGASDIFACDANVTLFQIFAPAGTPHGNGVAVNDQQGWGSWEGGGCWCYHGNFCCAQDARVPVHRDIHNGRFGGLYTDGAIAGEVALAINYFDYVKGACTCNGDRGATGKRELRGTSSNQDEQAGKPYLLARNPVPMADTPYDGGQSATSDRSAGIGMEYESVYIQFHSEKAKNDEDASKTFQSKGKLVNDLRGTNWQLTVDALDRKGDLDAEIILDGKSIKLGTDKLWEAIYDAIQELRRWDPSRQSANRKVTIKDSPFDDWIIMDPPRRKGVNKVEWTPQVTLPMPLEGIQWLIENPKPCDLDLKMYRPANNQVKVLPEFFKTSPGGVTQNAVSNRRDVLGFFSLILTYAKAASTVNEVQSPKSYSSIMPRTDFTTIFQTQGISDVIPKAQLYEIVKALACFKNTDVKTGGNNYVLDDNFCTGSLDSPTPNNLIDERRFQLGAGGPRLLVREWMESIADGTVPDALTTFDEDVDSSIGGFKTALENVLGTHRPVPIFEFRKLDNIDTPDTVRFAKRIEENAVYLHRMFSRAS
ncbi:MAG: hypothetical protein Q9191_003292 [Dirinaria sp. TL-2023a]